MAAQLLLNAPHAVESTHATLSLLERLALRRAHPVSIIFNLIGTMWAFYFLWTQDGMMTVLVLVLSRILSTLSTLHANTEAISHTLWGKLTLLHLEPSNFILQLLGVFLGAFGLWFHDPLALLSAASVIVFGHAVGWGRVHASFSLLDGAGESSSGSPVSDSSRARP